MVGDAEKEKAMKSMYKRSQMQEGKREQEKLQRKKHVVESLHKPGIKYAHFHVRFNRVLQTELLVTPAPFGPSACTARREASCACVFLVIFCT